MPLSRPALTSSLRAAVAAAPFGDAPISYTPPFSCHQLADFVLLGVNHDQLEENVAETLATLELRTRFAIERRLQALADCAESHTEPSTWLPAFAALPVHLRNILLQRYGPSAEFALLRTEIAQLQEASDPMTPAFEPLRRLAVRALDWQVLLGVDSTVASYEADGAGLAWPDAASWRRLQWRAELDLTTANPVPTPANVHAATGATDSTTPARGSTGTGATKFPEVHHGVSSPCSTPQAASRFSLCRLPLAAFAQSLSMPRPYLNGPVSLPSAPAAPAVASRLAQDSRHSAVCSSKHQVPIADSGLLAGGTLRAAVVTIEACTSGAKRRRGAQIAEEFGGRTAMGLPSLSSALGYWMVRVRIDKVGPPNEDTPDHTGSSDEHLHHGVRTHRAPSAAAPGVRRITLAEDLRASWPATLTSTQLAGRLERVAMRDVFFEPPAVPMAEGAALELAIKLPRVTGSNGTPESAPAMRVVEVIIE